ncbi:HutD/Ves family protein [Kribbella endophytica]
MRYERAADQQRVPWRNGAGLTTELASGGSSGDFVWRVSLAEVTEDCDFSVFPDVDRTIILIDGPPMTLRLAGIGHTLTSYEPFHFDGGLEVRCQVSGPTRDLNVMTRRGRATASVSIEQLSLAPLTIPKANPLVLVCLDGSATLQPTNTTLSPGDVAELDEPVRITGDGHLAVIHLETVARAE